MYHQMNGRKLTSIKGAECIIQQPSYNKTRFKRKCDVINTGSSHFLEKSAKWRNLQKHSERKVGSHMEKRNRICFSFNDLFDIRHANAFVMMNIEGDKLFLTS